ncbi:UEV-domain-containing protein [Metschnikowia bicuspidata]|uniref:UEV-domain-containing protein n=1 Tax=Metschnikowia bicuspidata TaxID=27322 RepID=A0A4P9Z856_9ASCO|nr:UEV-domain-containing protein [Metschnikowia bicuspidata]
MSRVTKKVDKWLVAVLQPQYLYRDVAYHHIHRFLTRYLPAGFKIRTAVHTSETGTTQLLICLTGIIKSLMEPVSVSIWIPHNYPFADDAQRPGDPNGIPIVYVLAPPGTSIRLGNNIDAQGKVYHPYLSQWYSGMVPGGAADEFLLTRLMEVLAMTISQLTLLGSSVTSPGPQLPPKPPWSASQTPHPTGEFLRPPLPAKPLSSTFVDLKPASYRVPAPVRVQTSPDPYLQHLDSTRRRSDPNQYAPDRSLFPPDPTQYTTGPSRRNLSPRIAPLAKWSEHPADPAHSPHREIINRITSDVDSAVSTARCRFPRRSPGPRNNPSAPVDAKRAPLGLDDLMDKLDIAADELHAGADRWQPLAAQIECVLDPARGDSIDYVLPQFQQHSARINALHAQLDHHNNQARANHEFLEGHVKYLTERVAMVRELTALLELAGKLNAESADTIHLARGRAVALDELVTLDLLLLHQLYDVVANIKAHKDALSLVAGQFRGEPEHVNDASLDVCVKAVRSLARDLFWLEATRAEIAAVMGLEG